MIILRQKEYARKDYLDRDGNPLPSDLIRKVRRERNSIASGLKDSRKAINADYYAKPKLLRLFLPPDNTTGNMEVRNNRYKSIMDNAKESAKKVTKNAREISYFRKHPIYLEPEP